MRRVWTFTVMSVLLVWTCVFPMVGGALALWDYWPYLRNPVVPGAALPMIRFRATEPLRRCAACGGTCRCTQVTQTRSRGLPTGTTFAYACDQCKRTFTLGSFGGHVFNLVGAFTCFVVGFGCLPFGLVVWLMGLVVMGMSGVQLLAAARNPLIAQAVDEG